MLAAETALPEKMSGVTDANQAITLSEKKSNPLCVPGRSSARRGPHPSLLWHAAAAPADAARAVCALQGSSARSK